MIKGLEYLPALLRPSTFFTDALPPFANSQIAIDIYRAAFGGLANVPIKTKEMKLKRTPSGAELNASLGLSVKAALGLDKKDRKVKIRGLL